MKAIDALRGRAEALIYTTELSLKEYGDFLPEATVAKVTALLEKLKRLGQSDDHDALEKAWSGR